MACIKNMGNCPCPRCLIEKKYVYLMGSKADMNHRGTQKRVYDHALEWSINRARERIFKEGKLVAGTFVEALMNPKSLIPTRVSYVCIYLILTNSEVRVHLQNGLKSFLGAIILCLLWI